MASGLHEYPGNFRHADKGSSLIFSERSCFLSPRNLCNDCPVVFSFILLEIHSPSKACRARFISVLQMRKQTQRGEVMCLFNKCPSQNWNQRLLTSVTAPPGYAMRVKPDPSRNAKCLSLIFLTVRKQSFTRTQVHSIISQKSILGTSNRSAQRVLTFLLAALVRVQHLLSAYSTPGTLCGIRSKSDRSHSSGLMSNPKAANERLLGSILPLAFCLIPTVLNIFFIINCQLLASLKWATSAGFLNIKLQPPLPLTQDKSPLEMTSVPTFSYCLSSRQLWPNSPLKPTNIQTK